MKRPGVALIRRASLVLALLAFALLLSPSVLARVLTRDGRFDGGFDPSGPARIAQLALAGLALAAASARAPHLLRSACEKAVLAGVSALSVLGLANLFVPLALASLPIGLHGFVPEPFDIVAQSSKRSTLPTDYVAIMGDSYGYGMGDWRIGIDHWSRSDWQASHLLHDATGVDVISFARPGRSSIGAYVNEPIRALRTLRHRYPIQDPKWILAYFYEGNDLSENLRELDERRYHGALVADDFDQFLEVDVLSKEKYEIDTARFLGIRFLARLLRGVGDDSADGVRVWGSDLRNTARGANRARIGDSDVLIPLANQAAPVDIVGPEFERALLVFRLSLEFMARQFPSARIQVVYIPAPLSIYDLGDHLVVESNAGGSIAVSRRDALLASDRVAERIRAICTEEDIPFVDTRARLRVVARQEPLHGPLDWRHFNRRGYEELTGAILADWSVTRLTPISAGERIYSNEPSGAPLARAGLLVPVQPANQALNDALD